MDPRFLWNLGNAFTDSWVRTADSWLGSFSLVIFKFFFIGFLESCSPLLLDYGSSSKKKVKNLQKKATCPSFCNFLKKIYTNSRLLLHLLSSQLFQLTNHIIGFKVRDREHVRMNVSCLYFCYMLINQYKIQTIIVRDFRCNQKFRVKLR